MKSLKQDYSNEINKIFEELERDLGDAVENYKFQIGSAVSSIKADLNKESIH